MRPGTISVCHVASGDRWAGAEVQIAALTKALARRGQFDLSAILLNEGRLAQEIRSCGILVKIIPESARSFLGVLREAKAFLREKVVQVLHSHRYKENILAGLLARQCNVPVLVRTQHGLPEPFRGVRDVRQRFLQRLDLFVARRATDCVISVSEEMRCELALLIPDRKIRVIPNGIDLEFVRSEFSPQQAKRRLGIPEEARVVGVASRLDPIKRLDLFLAAARETARHLPGARFVIAGEGGEEAGLRRQARELGLEAEVSFLGHRNDVYDVIRSFDVLVLCSDHEGLPTVLLEALQLGVPVVARRVGGIGEVIENQRTGVLLDSADPSALAEACLRLLSDENLRQRLLEAGSLLVAERYDSRKAAAEVAELYRSLCEAR